MTQFSQPWSGTATGDAGAYSHTQWSNMWKRLFVGLGGTTHWGVLSDSTADNSPPLKVGESTPAAASVTVSPGAALVNGKYYFSDANETLSIGANVSGNDRIDTVVLRAVYTAQTIRLVVLAGTPAASPVPPSLTQTDGVQWEIPLADVYVSNGFVSIADTDITDRRVSFVRGELFQDTTQILYGAAGILVVGVGRVSMLGASVRKHDVTILDLTDNDDWVDGASAEAASSHVHVYMSQHGAIKLHNKWPVYSEPTSENQVATAVVNQAGWNGTAGSGLNATTITYDGDVGEDNIRAGMLMAVFDTSDTDQSLFRGKATGASFGVKYWSWALVASVNTAANTVTVLANHAIAINDNDLLLFVQPGRLAWRLEGSTWWKYLGSMYNDGSSNLKGSFDVTLNGTDYNVNSGTFQLIDAAFDTYIPLNLDEILDVEFFGQFAGLNDATGAQAGVDLNVNGTRQAASETYGLGLTAYFTNGRGTTKNAAFAGYRQQFSRKNFWPPGLYHLEPYWARLGTQANTVYMYEGGYTVSLRKTV